MPVELLPGDLVVYHDPDRVDEVSLGLVLEERPSDTPYLRGKVRVLWLVMPPWWDFDVGATLDESTVCLRRLDDDG